MADERKRIIEFDSAEEVYPDAQLAMDSASHGTKKISPTLLLQGLTDAVDGLTDSLSDEYNSAATYAVGDYCIYNNRLYKCTTAISTAEAWNPSHWTPTSCDTELSELKTDLVNNGIWVELLGGSVDTTGEKNLSDDYRKYKTIIIILLLNGSKTVTATYPSNYLLPTGYKVYLHEGSDNVLLKFTTNTTVNIESITTVTRIYGQK